MEVCKDRDTVASRILNVFRHEEQHHNLLRRLAEREINNEGKPRTSLDKICKIFCFESSGTRCRIEIYFSIHGCKFLMKYLLLWIQISVNIITKF